MFELSRQLRNTNQKNLNFRANGTAIRVKTTTITEVASHLAQPRSVFSSRAL